MQNNENYLVEMKDIVKTFPGTRALDGVSLYLGKGEIHALVGENGAGKSTLMNVLTGQYSRDSGTVLLEGKPVHFNSPKDAVRNNIILVPQEINLVSEASIAENVFLGNETNKGKGLIDWKKTASEAERILKQLNVELDVSQPVKDLSAAYQQLVMIARALAYDPKVLILDEPTAVLTDKETEKLFDAMQKLKKQGTSMVFISHHLDEVMTQCDRVTIMRDGTLVEARDVKDITKEEMINLMAGKKIVAGKRVERQYSDEVFLETKNLTRYGEYKDISLQLHKGEILCIAGLVGAGRTEVFKSVFGITHPDEGEIYIEGNKVDVKDPTVALKYGMGYVSEERRHDGIAPEMSVLENMMLPSLKDNSSGALINWSKVIEICDEYIQAFSIKTAGREALIKNLSGGNQQKVIVARWLAKKVRMLILDEPTRGIDVNAKGEIHALIRQMADEGVAVAVISSEMEEVLQLADRIMVMHNGVISGWVDNPAEVTQEDVLKIAFK